MVLAVLVVGGQTLGSQGRREKWEHARRNSYKKSLFNNNFIFSGGPNTINWPPPVWLSKGINTIRSWQIDHRFDNFVRS